MQFVFNKLRKWPVIFLFVIFVFIIAALRGCILKEKSGDVFKSKVNLNMNEKDVKKVVLDNGFTILIFRNKTIPKVLMQIAYDVGSCVEQSGEKGLAHLIEHMIFKGTDKLSEGDIDAISKKYGASYNAFTANDMTSYYFEVDKNNWKEFIPILADCMQNARFDSQHLASELRTVLQELRMYLDRYWNLMIQRAFQIMYPANHPYHCPVIGFKHDLLNVTAEKLKKFYKKYYKPNKAVLFIVGDIDTDEAIKIAKKNFENIKNGDEIVDQNNFPCLYQETAVENTIIYEDVKNNLVSFYWKIPGLKCGSEILTSVVEFILGWGEGSRLYTRLVEEEKVATSISAVAYQLMESGIFFICLEPVKGKTDVCKKLIAEALNKLVEKGVTSEELQKVLKTKKREFFQRMQNLSRFTYEWIESYFVTKDEFKVFDKVNEFSKINSEQIQKYVKTYLDSFFMNQIEVVPLPENKKELWLKSKKEEELLSSKILQSHPRTSPIEDIHYAKNLPDPNPLKFNFPKPTSTFVLDNGLTVLLRNNNLWPIVSINCRFKQATFLTESKEGILLDLMMASLMEGTKNFSKKDNVDFFEKLGVSYSFDVSGASFSFLSADLQQVLSRFFSILIQPTFPVNEISKIKDIFIDLYQRRQDSPGEIGIRTLKNIIYKNTQYDWTFDQALELLKNVDQNKLKDLHKKFINPQNLILSIAGNFDLDEITNNIKDVFGSWSGREYLLNTNMQNDFKPVDIDKYMLRDQVSLFFGRPSSIDIYNPDLIPLKMLNFICFNSLGSRIYKLREQTGLFYNAFGMFGAGATRVHGFDYMGTILSLDTLGEAEKQILQVIESLGQNGAYKYELDSARQMYLNGLIDLTATNEAISSMLARLKSFELGFDYYDKVLNRAQNITLEELNQIAAKYFTSKDFARVRVGRVGK